MVLSQGIVSQLNVSNSARLCVDGSQSTGSKCTSVIGRAWATLGA